MDPASPTPQGNGHYSARLPSRPALRQPSSRPYPKKESPLSKVVMAPGGGPSAGGNTIGDSSDDESSAPAPLLSAAAEELLGVKTSESRATARAQPGHGLRDWSSYAHGSPAGREDAPSSRPFARERTASPSEHPSRSPRIVRIHPSSGLSGLRRTASASSVHNGSPAPRNYLGMKTPAPRPKSDLSGTRGSSTSPENKASGGSSNDNGLYESSQATASGGRSDAQEPGPYTGSQSVYRHRSEEPGLHSSLRIKRVGKVAGRYLSGPARRGMVRRQSEEGQSPLQRNDMIVDDGKGSDEEALREMNASPQVRFAGSSPLGSAVSRMEPYPGPESAASDRAFGQEAVRPVRSEVKPVRYAASSDRKAQPVFKVPPLSKLPSIRDQENEPPSTFKRDQHHGLGVIGEIAAMHDQKSLMQTPATGSPQRKVLAPRSNNTPLRPAPPPPKMSILETATTAAGAASAAQSKKQRHLVTVNGKRFTRLECIGRGGSGKVYRVMAENFKLFALKRVSLEDVDEMAIRGFKGEIDLLRKLEKVDRVVRLYDFEINDEKQTLSVLMDIGELDLKKILGPRLDQETGRFDITFTRYIWKEMLECVQSVHRFDVVHSDLKPDNFVMMQGRLKLIDFGIANAIQDDTVNVHREQQIGTPNYMAPEALLDTNASNPPSSAAGKMMKLGKPSDVWSLGCILYQVVYGKPPFGHLGTTASKVMAIVDRNHAIAFPAFGLGGKAVVPVGLLRTMKRCLNRDQKERPTVDELLGERDPFLCPDAVGTVPLTEDLLGKIQSTIVRKIRERGTPDDAELAVWQANLFQSVRIAVEEGKV